MSTRSRSGDSDEAWDQWTGVQHDLWQEVDGRIDRAVSTRSDAFAAALCASLIESLGEKLRFYLTMPATDAHVDEDARVHRPPANPWIPLAADGLPPETYPSWRRQEIAHREGRQ